MSFRLTILEEKIIAMLSMGAMSESSIVENILVSKANRDVYPEAGVIRSIKHLKAIEKITRVNNKYKCTSKVPERYVHERDLYHIEGEDFHGNLKEVNTSAFGPAHAEQIASRWLKHIKKTECLMVGGGGWT